MQYGKSAGPNAHVKRPPYKIFSKHMYVQVQQCAVHVRAMYSHVPLQAQSTLEADRSTAEQRATRLQDEVARHQERVNALLAASSGRDAADGGGSLRAGARGGNGMGGKSGPATLEEKQKLLSDRDRMLAQVCWGLCSRVWCRCVAMLLCWSAALTLACVT